MILKVNSVSKSFGGLDALTKVSFNIAEGEILGLIGPNGAGKTTLFNTINGVYRPNAGRIVFRDEDITGFPPYNVARRGLARTYQVVRPLNELTVLENVMVGACFGRETLARSEAAKTAAEILAMVGLAERSTQPAGSLNVAQKKRLELARALAARPYLLLLDEVLAGLNPSEITGMIETVRSIRESGITILMIEHVMQAVMNVSDRLVVLDYGEVIAEGRPAEIIANAKVVEAYLGDPKTAELLMSAANNSATD
jgi:branched-chain amino acid transport system ATP-binding protein